MRRRRSARVAQRHAPLMERRQARNAEPPFWGDRRRWAHLRIVDGRAITKKRGLLRGEQLRVKSPPRRRATRIPARSKPRPNQWWGLDMPTVPVGPVGWGSMVLVLAWDTKTMGDHTWAGTLAQPSGWTR